MYNQPCRLKTAANVFMNEIDMNVGTLIRDLQAVAIAEKGVDWAICRSSEGDADLSPGRV
jgi:hypothetical protein